MHDELKRRVATIAKRVYRLGLTWGPGGNVSAFDRQKGHVVITATGVSLGETAPENLAVVDLGGNVVEAGCKPSSETPMHTRVYREMGTRFAGLVHTHSRAATAVSCLRRALPAIHYLMGAVGKEVPLAAYATYGTPQLGDRVVEVIGDNKAVLLANHGALAAGADIEEAAVVAETVEYVADLYLRAGQVGKPEALSPEEIDRLAARFASYGSKAT
jgi:L-fuculose-phosphate aldolase